MSWTQSDFQNLTVQQSQYSADELEKQPFNFTLMGIQISVIIFRFIKKSFMWSFCGSVWYKFMKIFQNYAADI